jgi:hypothetical protein
MMPMKLTSENANGTEMSCGHSAAEGRLAREAKSGALLLWNMRLDHGKGNRMSDVRDERRHITDT